MKMKADNAVVMAAGVSSRFAPISYEKPKALIAVKGEILIERQIRQLKEAGIPEIIIITGYMKEQFSYLKGRFGVAIIENPEYLTRNNNGSIYAAREFLKNSYICSADNYFTRNPFEKEVDGSYYAAVYAKAATDEWCMKEDEKGYIREIKIGGEESWYMMGHSFWSEPFSRKFLEILEREYARPETKGKLWEHIFREHLRELPMKIRKYNSEDIYEFDSLDELREFDPKYKISSGSAVLKAAAGRLGCEEGRLINIKPWKDREGKVRGIQFQALGKAYRYDYERKILEAYANE